jgi:hypothetical protein
MNVNPGPWVNPETVELEPWRTQHGSIKLVEFPVRNPNMSRRAFHLYWQKHHSPHVMNLTAFSQFIRKYNSAHIYPIAIPGLPVHYDQDTQFEGASELWLDSLDEIGCWFSQSIYNELISHDEQRFLDQNGSGEFILAKEERIYDPEPDLIESLKTKVYILVKRQNNQNYNEFHSSISRHGQLIIEQPSLKAHLVKLSISHKLADPIPEGFELADVDAIIELLFDDVAAAKCFFADPAFTAKILPSENESFDTAFTRALVAKIRVVHDEFSFQPSVTQPMPFSWDL